MTNIYMHNTVYIVYNVYTVYIYIQEIFIYIKREIFIYFNYYKQYLV